MDKYFENKVAVVTGAAGVICSEVSRDLASLGCTVALVDLSYEHAEKVAASIRENGGNAKAYACNVMDREAVNALSEEVIKDFGRCDILINGAGGNNAKCQPKIIEFDPRELEEDRPEDLIGIYNVDMDVFESIIKLNTMGTVYPLLAFAKFLSTKSCKCARSSCCFSCSFKRKVIFSAFSVLYLV